MISVLLVDDHAMVRCGIRRILADADDIKVIGEAQSGEEAIELVKELSPQVVLMDVNMPGMGGIEATRTLLRANPSVRIIALTAFVEEPYPTNLLKVGAAGYLTKDSDYAEIAASIRAVAKGEIYLDKKIAQKMALAHLPGGQVNVFDSLSKREMQVMLMLTNGQCLQDVSDKLCLSPKTIGTYRYRLYEKLSVTNDVELTHLAIRHGMISTDK